MKHARVRTYVLNWTMRVAAHRGTEAIRHQCLPTHTLIHQRTAASRSRVTNGDHSRGNHVFCARSSYSSQNRVASATVLYAASSACYIAFVRVYACPCACSSGFILQPANVILSSVSLCNVDSQSAQAIAA